ncbi:MAG: helix-turn-helix transcriptional regulator [Deltaproteobacteria bacterium]|nr:helix-turn-helix transcriptional regulator [Deltaproteobacteria bacterium]
MENETKKYGVYLWGGHFLYLGRLEENVTEHMHHALQVIIDRKGEFDLRIDKAPVKCGGVIIGPDRRHQLVSSADTQAHLFIDREEAVARAIARHHLGDKNFKILDGPLLERLRGVFNEPDNFLGPCAQAHDVYRKIVTELGGYAAPAMEAIDPRIRGVMALVQEKLFSEKVTIAELARNACLSESRLMHLFSKQIGIPLRRYVLWQRVLVAMRMIAQGKMSLTEAAHAAGFSDSAHLSRTYRSMFGLTLSHCSNLSQFVQVTSCFSE